MLDRDLDLLFELHRKRWRADTSSCGRAHSTASSPHKHSRRAG
jgi:hypothetical protein